MHRVVIERMNGLITMKLLIRLFRIRQKCLL
nr:MAG TPA: hypothetical protein [Caudoviricetes sp.]